MCLTIEPTQVSYIRYLPGRRDWRLHASRVASKFKLTDGEIIFIKNAKGKEYQYSTWSRPIENPSEFQINTNLLIQRGVKRIKKNPAVQSEHPPNPLQDPSAGPKTTDPQTNI